MATAPLPNDAPAGPELHGPGPDVLVVVVGVLATLCLFLLARHWERRFSQERLERLALEHYRAATQELSDQRLVIESTRGLWAASDRVERQEFEDFVAILLQSYTRLHSIEWVPVVPAPAREEFERAAREELPGFAIHDIGPTGQQLPAPPRATCYPVLFAAPAEAAAATVGFDRGSDPVQREAFELAAATGALQTRGPYRTLRDVEQHVFHSALPVYKRPGVAGSADAGSGELSGFIVCSFDAGLVLDLSRQQLDAYPITVEVTDVTRGTQLAAPGSRGPRARAADFTRMLDLGGMQWRLDYRNVDSPWDLLHVPSLLVLGFGLILTLLLTLHLKSGRARRRVLADSNLQLSALVREREAAEAQAREAQREHATLLSNLPGMAYRCLNEPDWPMTFLSDGCRALTGYRRVELQAGPTTFSDLIHPGDRERIWRQVQERIEQRLPFELTYRIQRQDGQLRWVWEQGRGVFDRDDRLSFLEGFITDITAQKRAEQGLRKEKHFSDTAIDSLPGVFYLFDSNGKYLRWNQNLEQVTGYSREEVAEMHPLQFIPPEEHALVEARIGEVFETGSSTVEAHLLTKAGERIAYFFTGRRVTLDDQLCLIGMGVDVTDRVRAEEERRAIQAKALETQRLESVGLLAGGIAHDFNNLLTSVIGNVRFARDRVPASSPANEFLALASQAAYRAGDLTQQLLAYTGRAAFERLPIDLSEHIAEIAPLLSTSIPKKVDLELRLERDLPAIEADSTQIQQVVMNLVLNGAEACGERAGTVLVRTEARTLEPGQVLDPSGEPLPAGRYVELVVEDTGEGMDEATLARIFDPFFTTKFAGRGLGLAAVLGIVRGHGGALEVRSRPERGSTFEVLFPASTRTSVPCTPRLPEDLSGTGVVLVADDEPSVLRVLRQKLTECGYQVIAARDGREAVQRFRRQADEIDLVLLDMTMPEMTGAEALAEIRSVRPDVPALFSSGYDEELATRGLGDAGLAGFLQKPYTPEALAAKVKEILDARRPSRSGPG